MLYVLDAMASTFPFGFVVLLLERSMHACNYKYTAREGSKHGIRLWFIILATQNSRKAAIGNKYNGTSYATQEGEESETATGFLSIGLESNPKLDCGNIN